MAISPRFKVHNHKKEYVASCKYLEDAAILVGNYPDGAFIKDHLTGKVVWTNGKENFSASESSDGAARIMRQRIEGV